MESFTQQCDLYKADTIRAQKYVLKMVLSIEEVELNQTQEEKYYKL